MISNLVYYLALLAAVLTACATVLWIAIVGGGNGCWAAFAFTMGGGSLGGGILLLGIAPAGVLYFRKRGPRDRKSLTLAGLSFVILLCEVASLWILPMRGE